MAGRIPKTREPNSQLTGGSLRTMLLLVGLIALLGMIYLGQNGQATMAGHRAQDLKDQYDRIQRENAQLELEIAQLMLPARVADRAKALGFHPATITQTVFMVVKNYPVESKPVVARPAAPAPGSLSQPSLWDNLLALVGLAPTTNTAEATGP